jgi:MinD-like ATPase involved in chromosome partitioning or flagellar assembly
MPHEEPSSGELDGVEARAAALQEQIAARRAQRIDPGPHPADHGAPDNGAPSELVDVPEPPSADGTGESVKRSPNHRLAPPPWQLHTSIGSRVFAERFEAAADSPPPESRPEASDRDLEPRIDEREAAEPAPPEGDWQQGPPQPPPPPPPQGWVPPPPGWMPPPPGWIPPPPPGWAPPPRDQHAAPASPNAPPPQAFRMPPSLDEAEFVHRARNAPQSGWRRTVHRASGGRINPGESRKEREKDDLLAKIRQPIVGDFRIAVLSIKGGVGKTTTTLGLGSALATIRNDRVIAVDANPDRGTLAERVSDASTPSTVRDLLSDPNINGYADVRSHTRMAGSRLEVLASEQEPAVSEVFGEEDYRRAVEILRHYYNIILTDCGTGIMHSAMAGVLDLAHTIVLVSSPAIDAARSASATLDWLIQHGHSALVREAHVVLSASRPGSAALKLDKVYEHFEARCRSVHLIPFDPHLAEGADVDFSLLKPATFEAYLELAGAVAEKFPRLRGGRHRQ